MKVQYWTLCVLFLCLSLVRVNAQEITVDSLLEGVGKIDAEEELIRENEALRREIDDLNRTIYAYRNPLPLIDDPSYEIKLYQLLYAIETAKNVSDPKVYKPFDGMLRINYQLNGDVGIISLLNDPFYLTESYVDKKSLKYRLYTAILQHDTLPLYPVTSRLILKGRLWVEDTVRIDNTVHPTGIKRIEFPQLSTGKIMPLEQKKVKAEQLLDFIMAISDRPPFERYSFDTYTKLEKREVPDNDVNKLFKIRYTYILYLKKLYEKM